MESDGPIFCDQVEQFEQVDNSRRTNLSRFKAIGIYALVMYSSFEVASLDTYSEHRARSLVASAICLAANLGAIYETSKLETTDSEAANQSLQ